MVFAIFFVCSDSFSAVLYQATPMQLANQTKIAQVYQESQNIWNMVQTPSWSLLQFKGKLQITNHQNWTLSGSKLSKILTQMRGLCNISGCNVTKCQARSVVHLLCLEESLVHQFRQCIYQHHDFHFLELPHRWSWYQCLHHRAPLLAWSSIILDWHHNTL